MWMLNRETTRGGAASAESCCDARGDLPGPDEGAQSRVSRKGKADSREPSKHLPSILGVTPQRRSLRACMGGVPRGNSGWRNTVGVRAAGSAQVRPQQHAAAVALTLTSNPVPDKRRRRTLGPPEDESYM